MVSGPGQCHACHNQMLVLASSGYQNRERSSGMDIEHTLGLGTCWETDAAVPRRNIIERSRMLI